MAAGEPLLRAWLAELGSDPGPGSALEDAFASGAAFGRLLAAAGLDPELARLPDSGRPDAARGNFATLAPLLAQLGAPLAPATAQGIIARQPGLAAQALYAIKQALAARGKDFQARAAARRGQRADRPAPAALEHAGRAAAQLTVRSSPTRGLLEAQALKSGQAAHQEGARRFFDDVLRKQAQSPNALMESLYLQRFTDEAGRLAAVAADAAAADAAAADGARTRFRAAELGKLAAGRTERAARLQHDKADDAERQELRVELALGELSRHRAAAASAADAADAAAGIEAFEMALRRLGAAPEAGSAQDGAGDGAPPPPCEGASATLGRIRAFAPTAAKLAESGGEYLAAIKARRAEEEAGRKEREVRRRRQLVEQQAARAAAEARLESDALLEVLQRRSAEEQRLAARLWQVRQEKAAMEADRRLREEQYAAQREADWEATLRREAELHRRAASSLKGQHAAESEAELAALREQAAARRTAEAAARRAFGAEVAWQLVQLAERVVEFRAASAGQAVPRRDWREWLALFVAGDAALGAPVLPASPAEREQDSARRVVNAAELRDYLAGQGEWACAEAPPGAPAAGGAGGGGGQHAALGRVVAELAALAQRLEGAAELPAAAPGADGALLTAAAAAEAAAAPSAAAAAIGHMPLKLAVAGAPFAGKSSVARALAQRFGLKLLAPEQLVADALAAARAWAPAAEPEAQAQELAADARAPEPEPPTQVLLGWRVLAALEAGRAVPDELLVELLLAGMQSAATYAPPPPEPAAPEPKPSKSGSGAAKPGGKADGGAPGAKPSTAGGAPGAMLLERALTGLDTEAERELVAGASLATPPPADALPQLARPLRSGLDAVLLLSCADEGAAVRRALGRRLDPATGARGAGPFCGRPHPCRRGALLLLLLLTRSLRPHRGRAGRVYHLDLDPPPANEPGLSERLTPDGDAAQAAARLASHAAAAGPLAEWLSRFCTLRRPLDGGAELGEVLAGAGDVAAGILRAKAAAHAADAAAGVAARARGSAEAAGDAARAAQAHTEAAARELLAAKRAEIQAAALLGGGKNPDPAAAEVLKAQAAAKCAEQLKVCRAAAADAAGHAARAGAASASAAAAVQRIRCAVGDAAVSADAQAAVSKAAAEADSAAAAALDAARKAGAAQQLSEAFVGEAERWSAVAQVAADAAVPSAAQLTAALAAADAPPADAAGCGGAPPGAAARALALRSPASLPAAAVAPLAAEWAALERAYVDGMARGFAGLRDARRAALGHAAAGCAWFAAFLRRPDGKQALVQTFLGELLLRCEELRDALWGVCDARHEEAEAARLRLAGDGAAAEHVALLGQHLTALVQVELDRFLATTSFLYDYAHLSHGIFSPPGADKPLCPLPTLLAAAEPGRTDAAAKPRAAAAAAAAARRRRTWPRCSSACRASPAAAAAGGGGGAGAAAHRPSVGGAARGGAGAGAAGAAGRPSAAAAAASKLAASSEEAAAAASAASAAVAALPDPAALAAAAAELQGPLADEVALLQARLALLGAKAVAVVEELVALTAGAHARLAEWAQARYVAECGAVAALERAAKAAAAGGAPLPHDLRLEDDCLVIDEGQLLLPPPPAPPPRRPPSPPEPPGVLALGQLAALADALAAAAPGGFLAVAEAAELLLRGAAQGLLPPAWTDVDPARLAAALAGFDPACSGYLDWRELLLALAGAAVPALHAGVTPAQVAAQAAALAAADGDGDGRLSAAEFEGLGPWWFEPRPEAARAAREAGGEAAAAAAREEARCRQLRALLWRVFEQPPPADPAAGAADGGAGAGAGGTDDGARVDACGLLLHLCPDRDLYAGIAKAAAARAPLSAAQVESAVAAAAAEAAARAPGGGAGPSSAPGHGSAAVQLQAPAAPPAPPPRASASALMYSAATERLVALLLARYQLRDVFIAARM
ncbi:SPEF2 [Scenedesmus sp. PABB004]|nr:SPEF2 [Scenedesmus sp. PABB004]